MAVPVVVQASTVVHGSAVALIDVTLPVPVTAGNAVILIMVAASNISGRTYTITDTAGWGGWALALMYNPNTGGTVHYRYNCPAQTNTIRITQSSSTFTGSFMALEVSGLASNGIITTGTHSEASARTAHTCSSVATTGTDCFVACFSGLTATAGGFGAYGAGYTGGYGANTRCIQYKVTASHNDAGPWTTTGTARIGMGGMAIFPNAGFTPVMTRVQATGKARLANSASPLTFSFSTLPVVGNALVVMVWGSDATAAPLVFADGWVWDNQGNYYALAVTRQTPTAQFATAIYVCPKIAISSGTFTISISSKIAGRLHWWVGSAVEVGGLGAKELALQVVSSASAASAAAVSSGATAAVTGEAFLAATMTRGATTVATSIVVEATSPAWVQEAEELDGSAWMAGEADTRILPLTGPTTANWTQAANAASAATIAVFQAVLRTAPSAGLSFLTTSGKQRIANSLTLALPMSPVPALTSGLVVVVAGWRGDAGMTFVSCADNRGNTWGLITQRRITTNGEYAIAAFYCPKVAFTGSPFTITVTGEVATHYLVGAAYEVGGVGDGFATNGFVTHSGSGTNPNTFAAGELNTGETLFVGGMVRFQNPTSIVAETLTPPWVEMFEELDATNWIASEGLVRIATVSAQAASASWTTGTTGNWAVLAFPLRATGVVAGAARQQMGTII